jgi:3-hydroxyisobutyrate dehydrogenase
MLDNRNTIGWIGTGRMGYSMAERLLKAGYDVSVWNRTKSKAEPLAKLGGKVVDRISDLAGVDVLFSIVSTGKDLKQVYFGPNGVLSDSNRTPRILVDCSTIAVEDSIEIRERLAERNATYIAAAVSGNAKVIKAGRLSAVASGPEDGFREAEPAMKVFAPRGVFYVGEGELARIVKIAHNVMLGVVIQNLAEITILAQKAGVERHAFLNFLNNSVMGSMFTAYKTPALVNLDWTTTFTPELLRKDLDLGLGLGRELDVPMPVTAATREALQAHFGAASLKDDPDAYLQEDFAALIETVALASGIRLEPENVPVSTGLEDDA